MTARWTRSYQTVGERHTATIGPVRVIAWVAEGTGRFAFRRIFSDGALSQAYGFKLSADPTLAGAKREALAVITDGA